jgi:hypothetical protein
LSESWFRETWTYLWRGDRSDRHKSSVFGGVGGAVIGGGSRNRNIINIFNKEENCPTIIFG